MPCDVFTLRSLSRELNETVSGAKIDKIYQPEKDEIVLSLRKTSSFMLSISANPNFPRISVTTCKKENPVVAPAFCMHLRKYLSGARIESVSLLNNDRAISLNVSAKNELFDTEEFLLVAELTGRTSNIILVNRGKISDAIKHIGLDSSRQILPGIAYEPLSPNKTGIFDKNIDLLFPDGVTEDSLLARTSGFSRQSARQIAREYLETCGEKTLGELISSYDALPPGPCVTLADGKPVDYFIKPYYEDEGRTMRVNSLSEAIDLMIGEKDRLQRIREKSRPLRSLVKNAVTRTEKKLNANRDKMSECLGAEKYRLYADLLISNIYRVPKGSGVVLENFYDDMKPVEIPLSPEYSVKQNIQNYYKKYNKLKRGEETVSKMISENEKDLDYFKEILREIDTCGSVTELADIEEEMNAAGLATRRNGAKKAESKSRPIHYSFRGTDIYVGKNNYQNDRLTFKSAAPTDTWLHALKIHGSHVIIRSPSPDKDTLVFAAELAAYYSDGREDSKVSVDFTKVARVKRSPEKRPGLVNYTFQQTLAVVPSAHTDYIVEK